MQKLAILISRVIVVALIIAVAGNVDADKAKAKEPTIYSTWRGLELDKCATAWLIKRFVDEDTQFKFFPKGTFIKEGIPFDTPDSDLRRDARMTVFGRVMQKHKIRDAVLEDIDKIVWDVEVNSWDKKVTAEAMGVDAVIQGIILITENDEEGLEKSLLVFDALYAHLKSQRDLGARKASASEVRRDSQSTNPGR